MTQTKNSKINADVVTHIKRIGKNGEWPYIEGREMALEPSIWAALACREDTELRQKFVQVLLSKQNADGGWSASQHIENSDWTTGIALLGLRLLGDVSNNDVGKSFQKAVHFLMDSRADYYKGLVKALYLLWKGPEYRYPRGWPWTQGTFDWVEPTAYTLLAIRGTAFDKEQKRAAALADAEQFLLDSYCYPGGWDCADRTPRELKASEAKTGPHVPYPYPSNTALALLALQSQKNNPVITKGLDYLTSPAPDRQSVLGLSWTAITLHAFDRPADAPLEKLHNFQREDGTFSQETITNALAAIALTLPSQGNPLKSPLASFETRT